MRRLEQLARLGVAQRRRRAFVTVGGWALHAVDRIAGNGVVFAEIIEQAESAERLRRILEAASPRFSRSLRHAMT